MPRQSGNKDKRRGRKKATRSTGKQWSEPGQANGRMATESAQTFLTGQPAGNGRRRGPTPDPLAMRQRSSAPPPHHRHHSTAR